MERLGIERELQELGLAIDASDDDIILAGVKFISAKKKFLKYIKYHYMPAMSGPGIKYAMIPSDPVEWVLNEVKHLLDNPYATQP